MQNSLSNLMLQLGITLALAGFAGAALFAITDYATSGVVA